MLKTVFVAVACFGALLLTDAGISKVDFLDNIVRNALEDAREKILNITENLGTVNLDLNFTQIYGNLSLSEFECDSLANYSIDIVHTTLIPLRVENLTLSWQNIDVYIGQYFIDCILDLEQLQGPVDLSGDGEARVILEDVKVTIEIDLGRSDTQQFSCKDLKDFDITLLSSNVTITNFMENPDFSELVSVFFSYFIKNFVDDQKFVVFETLKPTLLKYCDLILAGVSIGGY